MSAPLTVKHTELLEDETPASEINSNADQRGWWFTKSDDTFNAHDVVDLCKGFDRSLDAIEEEFEREVIF